MKCPLHKRQYQPRDMKRASDEQKWCGKWYDCGQGCSMVEPSKELRAHLAEQAKRQKRKA